MNDKDIGNHLAGLFSDIVPEPEVQKGESPLEEAIVGPTEAAMAEAEVIEGEGVGPVPALATEAPPPAPAKPEEADLPRERKPFAPPVLEPQVNILMSIRSHLIIVLVLVATLPLIAVGIWNLYTLQQANRMATEQSEAAVVKLGEAAISETAQATARQIELYLEMHPKVALTDIAQLESNTDLAEIAVQPVGQTGYTAVFDENAVTHFHVNPEIVGMDMSTLSDKLPEFWAIFAASLDGSPSDGYYDWEDADGQIRAKYMSIVPVRDTPLRVAATTYIDEFSQPVVEIRSQLVDIQKSARSQLLSAIGGVILVVSAVAFTYGQWISRPIRQIADAATRVAAGDLSPIDMQERGDEISVLARAFNAMADRVSELLTGLEERGQELEARAREIEASQRVTFAASERTSPDMLLNLVVNLIRDQFHLYHVQVYIVDEQRQAAVLRQSTGYAGRRLLQRKHHIPLAQPALVTKAIHTGEPVMVADVSENESFMPNPLLPDTRSELVVPLKVGDRVIGALDVQDRVPGRFTSRIVTLFQAMTDQIAFLFENSELVERVTERTQALTIFTDQLRTAADIARQLGAILDPDRLLQQVVELIRNRFGLYHAHVYVLDEATRRLIVRAGSGEVGRVLRERGHSIPLTAEKSLVARAARTREPMVVEDTTIESDFVPNPMLPQTRSEMTLPLIVGDRVLGVLDMQDDQAGRFTQVELDTFSTLAGQLATALQTAGLFAQVQARLKVSQALAGTQTEEEVLDTMIAAAGFYPEAQIVIALYDQEAEEPTLVARRVSSFESDVTPVPVGARFPASRFKIVEHFTPGKPLVVSNLSSDERIDPLSRQFLTQLGVASAAMVAISVGEEQIGVVRASSSEENYFDERKLHLYQSIAEQGAIALRTARLFDETQRTAERLRELDRLKSEFLANMSHELRTPLNSIIGYTEIMLMGISQMDPDTLEDVEAIHNNGQHLLALVNDMLDMARIEAGRLVLKLEQVHVESLVDKLSDSAARLLADKPIEWVVEIADDLPPIQADPMRLGQILNNLISNAEKFIEQGSITLRAFSDDGWLCIQVQDTGIGIAEVDTDKIFDRFQQVDSSSTRRAGGTGLGLAITRHLVQLHGGTIEVESEPGQGSTFTVRLPVRKTRIMNSEAE